MAASVADEDNLCGYFHIVKRENGKNRIQSIFSLAATLSPAKIGLMI
jgi:hypothetical protein